MHPSLLQVEESDAGSSLVGIAKLAAQGESIRQVARILVAQRCDGVIATNTTVDRSAVAGLAHAGEAGGLSGRPLKDKATAVIRSLAAELGGALPIIGVGGILSGVDAREKIAAGATLVQIYTGLIYKGPELVAEIATALSPR